MADIVYSTQTAVPSLGNAVATLGGEVYPRDLHSVSVNGPKGSRVEFYLGAYSPGTRFDQSPRGDSNTADYATARPVPAGTPIIVVWPGQAVRSNACSATFAVSRK
jgi:hypothetical protein